MGRQRGKGLCQQSLEVVVPLARRNGRCGQVTHAAQRPPNFPPQSCHVRIGKLNSQSPFCPPQLTLHLGSKATVLRGCLTIGVRLRARGAQLALHLVACPVNLTANLYTTGAAAALAPSGAFICGITSAND
jgi:hypothetical protein